MADKQGRFSRRMIALFWSLALGVGIGILIYKEQIAFLYVLATLFIVGLLVIVGRADLENAGRENAAFSAVEDKV